MDVYTQYRSPDGHVESDCLLTTQVTRALGAQTDWDDLTSEQILATWRTRELRPGETLDPDIDALIAAEEQPSAGAFAERGGSELGRARGDSGTRAVSHWRYLTAGESHGKGLTAILRGRAARGCASTRT